MSSFFDNENLQVSYVFQAFLSSTLRNSTWRFAPEISYTSRIFRNQFAKGDGWSSWDGDKARTKLLCFSCEFHLACFTHQITGVSFISERRSKKDIGGFLSKQLVPKKTRPDCFPKLIPSAPDIPNCGVDATTVVVPAQHDMLNLPPCHAKGSLENVCPPKKWRTSPSCLSNCN